MKTKYIKQLFSAALIAVLSSGVTSYSSTSIFFIFVSSGFIYCTFCTFIIMYRLYNVKYFCTFCTIIFHEVFFMGEKLKQLRLEKGLTQRQVAEVLGLTVKGYNFYELNLREPPIDTLKKLCKLFNVTSDYLIGLTDEY